MRVIGRIAKFRLKVARNSWVKRVSSFIPAPFFSEFIWYRYFPDTQRFSGIGENPAKAEGGVSNYYLGNAKGKRMSTQLGLSMACSGEKESKNTQIVTFVVVRMPYLGYSNPYSLLNTKKEYSTCLLARGKSVSF